MRIFKKIFVGIILLIIFASSSQDVYAAPAPAGCLVPPNPLPPNTNPYTSVQASWNWVPLASTPLQREPSIPSRLYGTNAAYYYHTTHGCTGDAPPEPPTIAGRVVNVIVSSAFPDSQISSQMFRDGELPINKYLSPQDINFIAGATAYRIVPVENTTIPSGAAYVEPTCSPPGDRNTVETAYPSVCLPRAGTYAYKTYQKYYSGTDLPTNPPVDGASWYNDGDGRGHYKILNFNGTTACTQTNPVWCPDQTPANDNTATLTLSPFDDATCIGALPGGGMVAPGLQYTAYIQMQNRGGNVWTRATNYRLGSINPNDNTTWGMSRVEMDVDNIWPGNYTSFSFTVTAPLTVGTYAFDWTMMREFVARFGKACTGTVNVVDAIPVINGLQITNLSSPLINGTYGISGKTITQVGSDWLNPMNVIINADPGSQSDTQFSQFYVAFYTGAVLTNSSTFLPDVAAKINADSSSAILLRSQGAGYQVYDRRITGWRDIRASYPIANGYWFTNNSGFNIYKVSPLVFYLPEPYLVPGAWQVQFDQAFASKSMNTGVLLIDARNHSVLNGNITPSP